MSVISGLAVASLIYFGGQLVIAGELTVGEFVQFGIYLGITGWRIIALGSAANLLQQARAAIGRLHQAFDAAADDPRPRPLPVSTGPIRGEIEFRGVTFAHPTAGLANPARPRWG